MLPRRSITSCCIRCSTSRRRSIRVSTSLIGSARFFSPSPIPAAPGRPDLAVTLLEKGLAARPDKWEYMQDIGFVHYWWRHDYRAAAEWFDKASDVPGAPWFLRSLAATTLAKAATGNRRD